MKFNGEKTTCFTCFDDTGCFERKVRFSRLCKLIHTEIVANRNGAAVEEKASSTKRIECTLSRERDVTISRRILCGSLPIVMTENEGCRSVDVNVRRGKKLIT